MVALNYWYHKRKSLKNSSTLWIQLWEKLKFRTNKDTKTCYPIGAKAESEPKTHVLYIHVQHCTICENCHMIILCWPYLHVTIELYTCRSTGCFTFCFLIGEMRWLSCKSTAKEVHLQIWPGPTKHFQPPSMVAIQVTRRQLQTRGLSGSISSNIWLRFWVLTRSNNWASLGTACTQAKILQTG